MTKKDFIAIADGFKECKPTSAGLMIQWEKDRETMADVLAKSNPRFNRERWVGYIDGRNGANGGKA